MEMKHYVPKEIKETLCVHLLWTCGYKKQTPKSNFLSSVSPQLPLQYLNTTIPWFNKQHGWHLSHNLFAHPLPRERHVCSMYTHTHTHKVITQAHTCPYKFVREGWLKAEVSHPYCRECWGLCWGNEGARDRVAPRRCCSDTPHPSPG